MLTSEARSLSGPYLYTGKLALVSLLTLVGACDVMTPTGDLALPFEGPGWSDESGITLELEEGQRVFVGATHLDVKNTNEAQTLFDDRMAKLREVLPEQKGLIGYSLRQNVFNNDRYMTVSVWRSEEEMLAWVVSDAHSAAIVDFATLGEKGITTAWEDDVENVPPAWTDVEARLVDEGREY